MLKKILLFVILLKVTGLYSQQSSLRFKHFGINEGLNINYIKSIYQDREGFLWVGTSEGLNKYDGYKFVDVNWQTSEMKISAGSPVIESFFEDTDGTLWIATDKGLVKYNREKDKFITYTFDEDNPDGIGFPNVKTICRDSYGQLWIGSGLGFDLFDEKSNRFIHFQTIPGDSNSISSTRVSFLLEDSHKNLWIGTESEGLNLLDQKTKKFKRIQHDPADPSSLISNPIRIIFEDSKQNLWIGTQEGLDLYDRATGKFKHFTSRPGDPNSLSKNVVLGIEEDVSGNIWIGTEHGGLNILNPVTGAISHFKQSVSDPTSLNNNSVNVIERDNKGNMWVGTFAGGLNLYDREVHKFNHYKQTGSENSLKDNSVMSITEDSKGHLLIATDGGGLNIFDPETKTFSFLRHNPNNSNSICADNVLTAIEDSFGNLWIGTWGSGATMINKKRNKFTHFRDKPGDSTSIGGNNVWYFLEDRDKNIWIGTYGGGLSMYNRSTGKFRQFRNRPDNISTVAHDLVSSIYQDSKGYIWIATFDGLDRYDLKTDQFINFKNDETDYSISHNIVSSILEDKNGNIWVTTNNGLNCLNVKSNRFTRYTSEDGLFPGKLCGIVDDGKGNFWISTSKGLCKFNIASKAVKKYTYSDGLQSNEFKAKASVRGRSGKLYFGGVNGFNEFNPDSIDLIDFDPPIVFTDFEIHNVRVPISDSVQNTPLKKHISLTKELTLAYDQSSFTLEFATLNFVPAKKKQYSYFLEGFDKEWINSGIKHSATYTNLNPGNYIFKVRGLNNEGQPSDKILALKIIVTPPYWQTWWFRAMIVILFSSAIVVFYKVRINAVKAQNEKLEALVKERTAEVVEQKEEMEAQAERLGLMNVELEEHADSLRLANDEIKDSIKAAQAIQLAILPSEKLITEHLPEFFVLNKPKDVVSGDFYLFDVIGEKIVLAVADCTGHGVSGAFMSLIGHHLLTNCLHEVKELNASEILNELHEGIVHRLHSQENSREIQDGMDIALCIIDKKNHTIEFAGANNPLYINRGNKILKVEADKYAIGQTIGKQRTFGRQILQIEKGDVVYMFSDGYADQIGGEGGDEKFMYPRFRNLLSRIGYLPMDQQLAALEKGLGDWMKNQPQLDDILVMGFKVS